MICQIYPKPLIEINGHRRGRLQTGLHPSNDFLEISARNLILVSKTFLSIFIYNFFFSLIMNFVSKGCCRPVRMMWCRYSVGNDLVILYSTNSASFICEGGWIWILGLWAQKMSRSFLFPRNGMKSTNEMHFFTCPNFDYSFLPKLCTHGVTRAQEMTALCCII